MRILISIIFTLIFLFTFSQTNVNSQTFAEVIETISVNELNYLNFGKFSTSSEGGILILNTDGARISQGSVIDVSSYYSPGKFNVIGSPDVPISVIIPNEPVYIYHSGTNNYMIINDWNMEPPISNGSFILENGEKVIIIGATLNISSYDNNPVGVYSGTYILIFFYN